MCSEELKFPDWQIPLQEVVLEFDRGKLPEKVQRVEALIFERLKQLRDQKDGHGEYRDEEQAIADALSILRLIKKDKLGFPDWK